jgi:threonine/homoserine/homoserine lactone efflux protein
MNTDHAHVESVLVSIAVLGVIAVIDLFVYAFDSNPLKQLGYLGLFFLLYVAIKAYRRREWQ